MCVQKYTIKLINNRYFTATIIIKLKTYTLKFKKKKKKTYVMFPAVSETISYIKKDVNYLNLAKNLFIFS